MEMSVMNTRRLESRPPWVMQGEVVVVGFERRLAKRVKKVIVVCPACWA